MCLGVPGQILDLFTEGESLMGTVDFIGVQRKVCFDALPDVSVGEYVLVHVGFGLAKLDEENALQTIELMRGMGSYEDEFGPGFAHRANS
ncbi:MAG: HypC/HybG/HupF family hydrogenase formation chaperone [Actinomycetota bacterium]|nr:HypC/HybG/HupF family hydrogenase formation chaperone [Actinomycetota bacterium]